jgi:hypothetical protein
MVVDKPLENFHWNWLLGVLCYAGKNNNLANSVLSVFTSVFRIINGKQRNGRGKVSTALSVATIEALGLFGIFL